MSPSLHARKLAALAALALSLPVAAQESEPPRTRVIEPSTPTRAQVLTPAEAQARGGRYSARRLISAPVKSGGETVGEVHDILVNDVGKVTAVVVEAGDRLDIRDRHFRVPWHEARVAANASYLEIPGRRLVLAPRRGREQVHVRATEQRVRELLDEVVQIAHTARYAELEDLLIHPRGDVEAIVVDE